MTAQELFEVVKDVPREAWPQIFHKLHFDGDSWSLDDTRIDVSEAALMFEASMVRWLISNGHHSFEWDPGETDVYGPSLDVMGLETIHAPSNFNPRGCDILWLLAAAVRAVGEVQRGE